MERTKKALGSKQHMGLAPTTAKGGFSIPGHKDDSENTDDMEMPRADAAIMSKTMSNNRMQRMLQNRVKSMGVK